MRPYGGKSLEIAVIGGGHGCYAAAAHLSEQNHAVRLWRRDAAAFGPVRDSGKIKLTDADGTREVALACPTTELAEAIRGAELVVLPLPCTTHSDLAKELAPLWEDGQVAFLPPGTLGSYLFAQAMVAAGNKSQVSFAETGTLPYLARKQAVDHVRITVYATRLPTGAFPAKDSNRALDVIRQAYPVVEPLQDALDGALMNAGPIIHPPLILMNAGPLEHFDAWDIHNEGTQPAIRRVTDALDGERIRLREALGYGAPHFPLADHYDDDRDEWMYGDSSQKKLTDSGDWREHIDLLGHRYMREDTVLGLSLFNSLAEWIGVELPITRGILAIAGAILGEETTETERTLQALGLDQLDPAGLRALLKQGLPS